MSFSFIVGGRGSLGRLLPNSIGFSRLTGGWAGTVRFEALGEGVSPCEVEALYFSGGGMLPIAFGVGPLDFVVGGGQFLALSGGQF